MKALLKNLLPHFIAVVIFIGLASNANAQGTEFLIGKQ